MTKDRQDQMDTQISPKKMNLHNQHQKNKALDIESEEGKYNAILNILLHIEEFMSDEMDENVPITSPTLKQQN